MMREMEANTDHKKAGVNDALLRSLPSMPLAEYPNLPEIQAVYFIVASDGRVLYIGSCIDLNRRPLTCRGSSYVISYDLSDRWAEAFDIDPTAVVYWLEWPRQPAPRAYHRWKRMEILKAQRADMRKSERMAIRSFRPLLNVTHNPDAMARRSGLTP